MLQLEVVNRLAASPGNKNWGRLGIMAQYHCEIESLFEVPPTAFSQNLHVPVILCNKIDYSINSKNK